MTHPDQHGDASGKSHDDEPERPALTQLREHLAGDGGHHDTRREVLHPTEPPPAVVGAAPRPRRR